MSAVTFFPNYIQYAGFDAGAEPSADGAGQSVVNSDATTTNPRFDLLDNRNTNQMYFDVSGVANNPYVQIDLSANISPDFCIIDGNNFNTAFADVSLFRNGGATAIPFTLAYAGVLGSALTSITVASNEASYNDAAADGVLYIPFTAAVTDNDFRVYFDEDPVPLAYEADVYLAEIFFGVKFTPTYSPEVLPLSGYQFPGTNINISDGGQKYVVKRYGARRIWRLSWSEISSADKTSFETLFAVTGGDTYPFYITLTSATPTTLYFVRFVDKSLNFKQNRNQSYSLDITIEEEI